jgi:acetylxylan esterase
MAATYPDIFAAGIAYAGVPAGCFMSQDDVPAAWNSTCADGQSIYTQTQWANVVKNMYPGYTGPALRSIQVQVTLMQESGFLIG